MHRTYQRQYSTGTVKVTVADRDITGGFCPKTGCHGNASKKKKRSKVLIKKVSDKAVS